MNEKIGSDSITNEAPDNGERGMTLIETTVALVIIMIAALLGVVHSFTYAVTYNAGNAVRSESLALLQDEVENLRAAKWASGGIDNRLAGTGGGATCTTVERVVPSVNGGEFTIARTVDDDPSTAGCQVDATTRIKEISVTVIPNESIRFWQFAVPATVVMRRTKGN